MAIYLFINSKLGKTNFSNQGAKIDIQYNKQRKYTAYRERLSSERNKGMLIIFCLYYPVVVISPHIKRKKEVYSK